MSLQAVPQCEKLTARQAVTDTTRAPTLRQSAGVRSSHLLAGRGFRAQGCKDQRALRFSGRFLLRAFFGFKLSWLEGFFPKVGALSVSEVKRLRADYGLTWCL